MGGVGAAPALLPVGPRLLGRRQCGLLLVVALGGSGSSGLYRSSSRGGFSCPEVAPSCSSPGDGGALWARPSATSAWGNRGTVAAGRPSSTLLTSTLRLRSETEVLGSHFPTVSEMVYASEVLRPPLFSHSPVFLCPLAAYFQLQNLSQSKVHFLVSEA